MGMILKSISLKNFRSHENTNLSFNRGITTIIGPNGSGKSSIFEAISFALYGTSNYLIEDLIRRGARGFRVELVFEMGNTTYKVIRGRGKYPGDNINFLISDKGNKAEGYNEVNKRIEEVLGISRDVFLNAIYIKQGEIDRLINLEPSKRKKVIGEILGIDRFEKVWREMGEAITKFKHKLEHLKGRLSRKEMVEREIKEIEEKIRNMELELEKLEREYREVEGIYQERKKVLEEYREKERRFRELKDRIRDIEREITALEDRKVNLEKDLEDIKTLMDVLGNTEEKYRRYCEIEEDLKRVSSEMEGYRKYFNRYRSLIEIKEMLERDIEEIGRRVREEGVEGIQVEDVERRIESIEERLRQLEDIEKKLLDLEHVNTRLKEIERYREELERCKEGYLEYIEVENRLRDLEGKVIHLERLREKVKEVESRIEELRGEISKLERELAPLKEIEEGIKKEEELKDRLARCREELQVIEGKIRERLSKIKELEEIVEKLSRAGNRCPLCQSPIDDSKKEDLLRRYREELQRIEEELETLYRERSRYKEEIERLERLLQEIGDLKNEFARLKEREKILQDKYLELEEYIRELQVLEGEIERYRGVEEEREKLTERKKSLERAYRRYQTCEDFLERVDREELLRRREELLKVVGDYNWERVKREKEDLNNRLRRWYEIKKLIVDRREKEERLSNILREMEDIKKYAQLYQDLERKKALLEKEIERYREDYNRYINASAVLKNYAKVYKVDPSKLISSLENRIEEIGEKLATLKSRREEHILDIEFLGYSEEKHRRIEGEVEKARNNLDLKKNKMERYKAYLESLRENLSKLLKELRELEEIEREKERLERYIKYLEDIREQVFSRDGFQQYLRRRYIPLIQKYTNEIFSEFELPYHHIEIDEDYNILVDGLPVKNLSGGEQIAVSLALRLGIAKALCSSLQFIVLDEPTAFLDEERRKKLLNIFKSIKSISQIFIISHHQELEQIADNVIHVTKRGGISKVLPAIT
ncbi:MAG TPA: hypothetical protein EYH55_02305 [Methanothermococcus okinawensis]|uniref:DNA double-strand break repair Rad50 ATPase n=1 Tax=Methanothermococcus okinawensis TaxID=155863 RepID=A0A832ZY43_9EURY|nr:hypothetical protein [Methanothermococcus okinawensis]